jgi:transposase
MEEKKPRRRFDLQFKLDAVRLMSEGGRTVAQVARDLGISGSLLRRWRERFGEHPAKGNGTAASADNAELEKALRELALVKEEREILKKALAVFSRRPG